jgi:Cupredoxin-like domain
MTRLAQAFVLATVLALPAGADTAEYRLTLKEHRFAPVELQVLAGVKFRLVVENQDPTPEEFESYHLNREKIVPAKGRIVLFIGPLQPGRYEFFGEFNAATARGVIEAR